MEHERLDPHQHLLPDQQLGHASHQGRRQARPDREPIGVGGRQARDAVRLRHGCLRRDLFGGERHAAAFEREALAPADLALGVECFEDGGGHLGMGAAKHTLAYLFARHAVGERLAVVMRRQGRRHSTRQRLTPRPQQQAIADLPDVGRARGAWRERHGRRSSVLRRARPGRASRTPQAAASSTKMRSASSSPSAPSSGARSRARRRRVASARTPRRGGAGSSTWPPAMVTDGE